MKFTPLTISTAVLASFFFVLVSVTALPGHAGLSPASQSETSAPDFSPDSITHKPKHGYHGKHKHTPTPTPTPIGVV